MPLCQIYVHSISKCEYSRQEIYLQNIQGKGREMDKMWVLLIHL